MVLDVSWERIEQQHDTLVQLLLDSTLDATRRRKAQKDIARLSHLLSLHKEIVALEKSMAEIAGQVDHTDDPELKQLFECELVDLKSACDQKVRAIEEYLFPPDPHDLKSVFLEIRAGTGGQEAALFVADLMRMYTNYALKKGWRVSVEDSSQTDLGGYKEVILFIKGAQVFGHLKHESGVHRVQRVPSTEGSGRIHTSTVTVAVLPEAEDVEVTIQPSDLRIDVYRSSGAGGQHVNTTDSAVRITHIPTGVVVTCQDERSQHKNKAKALKILQSRLLAAQMSQQEAMRSESRREQIGGGLRAEKVRTYNFPQNRVTDHQVNVTLSKLDMVMEGDLDEIIQALKERDIAERKKQPVIEDL